MASPLERWSINLSCLKAEITIAEHSTSAAANAFFVQRRFFLGEKRRSTILARHQPPILSLHWVQRRRHPNFYQKQMQPSPQSSRTIGYWSQHNRYIGEANTISLQTAQGFTGGTSSAASSTIRRLHVGDHSEITVSGRSNANVDFSDLERNQTRT